jgi:hypothetical protein
VSESQFVKNAYEATSYFASMGGKARWLHFTAAVINQPGGQKICALETLEDITEQKAAISELKAALHHE